jgi:hypothetical protein
VGHCAEACHAPQAPAQAVKGLWGCVVDVEGMGVPHRWRRRCAACTRGYASSSDVLPTAVTLGKGGATAKCVGWCGCGRGLLQQLCCILALGSIRMLLQQGEQEVSLFGWLVA